MNYNHSICYSILVQLSKCITNIIYNYNLLYIIFVDFQIAIENQIKGICRTGFFYSNMVIFFQFLF